jgi:hypothetical protein
MANEFRVHRLNPEGLRLATEIATAFQILLDKLRATVPAGEELNNAIIDLQAACFWAKRALAENRDMCL